VGSDDLVTNVNFIETKEIKISKIIFDKNNPNKMTEKQVEALELTVDKYGFATDPWINKLDNGKYMVIDGEHRIRLLQKNNIKTVLCKIFKIKYPEVQMLRQIANKLRGEHDKQLDIIEFKGIMDDGLITEFNNMMAKPFGYFESVIENDGLKFLSDNIIIEPNETEEHRCIVKNCKHGQ